MEEDRQDVQLQPEATELEIVPLEQEVLRDDLEIREAEQTILLRYLITGVVLTLYASTLASTISLFYLAGFGKVSFSDNVLISLSGVFVGELGVGAILMVIIKSIFPSQ